jgi:hypothetical protein
VISGKDLPVDLECDEDEIFRDLFFAEVFSIASASFTVTSF